MCTARPDTDEILMPARTASRGRSHKLIISAGPTGQPATGRQSETFLSSHVARRHLRYAVIWLRPKLARIEGSFGLNCILCGIWEATKRAVGVAKRGAGAATGREREQVHFSFVSHTQLFPPLGRRSSPYVTPLFLSPQLIRDSTKRDRRAGGQRPGKSKN